MDRESILVLPKKQSILLPMPRIELEFLPTDIKRAPRRFARLPGENPATHNTHRWKTHDFKLEVRAEIRSDDEAWLESFYNDLMIALPGKTVDSDGNLVVVKPYKAERGGYLYRMVEPMVKRSIPVYISFEGGIYRDDQIPLITEVNLVDGVTYGG